MSSRYENLPVYKKALDMAVYFENVVRGFSRYHKYTVGSEIRDMARKVLINVAKANRKESRISCLEEAIEYLEQMKIVLHLCKEIKAFKSANSFEFSIKSIVDVSKQCEGWLRSQNQIVSKHSEGASSKSLGAHPTFTRYKNGKGS